MAAHHHFALLRTEVGAKLGLDLAPKGLGNQPDKVLADDLVGRVSEEPLGRRVIGTDDEPIVDRDDAVGDVVEDGADPVSAVT